MNRLYKAVILIIEFILTYFMLFEKIYIPCLIKKYFNISCPFCGITRAVKSLLKLDVIESLNYNMLIIPFIIFIITLNVFLIYDIVKNQRKTNNFMNILGNHYIFLIIIFIINTIINNIKRI